MFNLRALSNTFLITIFGGVFASTVVVLLCEMQKYYMNKRNAENALYYYSAILYANLLSLKTIVDRIIKLPEGEIFEKMLDTNRGQCSIALYNISAIDYNTWFKKAHLQKPLKNFCDRIRDFDNKLNECSYLEIAILTTKIELQKKEGVEIKSINGNHQIINQVAKILSKDFSELIEESEKLITSIDYSGRYKWKERKNNLQANSDIFSKDYSLKFFLKGNNSKSCE